MSHIFLSYSRRDQEYVKKLAKRTTKAGFEIWMDDRIDFGSKWAFEIEKNINECAAFIVVMTTNSRQSDWVRKELLRAQRLDKPIFPILLEGENWLELEDTQFLDLRSPTEDQTGWNLPLMEYYQDVYAKAPSAWQGILTEYEREEIQRTRTRSKRPLSERIDNRPKDPTIYSTITEYVEFVQNFPNDYLTLALLALAYAEEGSRAESIVFLRKAVMIEPRIKFRQWMWVNHGWTNRENALLEQVLADSYFNVPIDPLSFRFHPYLQDNHYDY